MNKQGLAPLVGRMLVPRYLRAEAKSGWLTQMEIYITNEGLWVKAIVEIKWGSSGLGPDPQKVNLFDFLSERPASQALGQRSLPHLGPSRGPCPPRPHLPQGPADSRSSPSGLSAEPGPWRWS